MSRLKVKHNNQWIYADMVMEGVTDVQDNSGTSLVSGGVATIPAIPSVGTITSGATGYATGGDVYTALGNKQDSLPSGSSTGDILYWSNGAWAVGSITDVISNGDSVSY